MFVIDDLLHCMLSVGSLRTKMKAVILVNENQCLSYPERNGVTGSTESHKVQLPFCYQLQRISRFPLNLNILQSTQNFCLTKVKHGRISALAKQDAYSRQIDESVLRGELEFKPSFDEYLKAMETVRTGRGKKSEEDDLDKCEPKNPSMRKDEPHTPSFKRDARDEEWIKLCAVLTQEKDLKEPSKDEEDGLSEKSFNGELKLKQKTKRTKVEHKPWRKAEISEAESAKSDIGSDRSANNSSNRDRDQKLSLKKDKLESNKWNRDTASESINDVGGSEMRGKGRVGGTRDEVAHIKWRNLRNDSVGTSDVHGKGRVRETRGEFENVKWKSLRAGGVGTSEMRGKGQVGRIRDEVGNVKRRSLRTGKKSMVEGSDDVDFGVERAAFKNITETTDVVDPPKVSQMEMEERIQRLAKSLNGADIEMPEWMFSKMMLGAQIRFSDHSIMRVIQLLGKLGNWRRVLQVISWLQKRERFKSHKIRHIYTAALDVLGKARRPVEALNIFHTMQQQIASYPDLVAYHSIAVTLGQAGHMKELFDVIDLMRSPNKKLKESPFVKWDPQVEPDIVVYNAVLNACVKRKQWEGAFWVLQQLKEKRAVPSATTYGLVMEVMFTCGKYNLVHEFFRKVHKVGIPNALTYKVLVNTLWKEGKIDEAIVAVEQMERRGIVGSAALYYDLARCLCSAGRSQEALLQIDKICRVANKPLVVTYTGLIQACLDSGKIQDGISIFQQMEKYCSPNLVTCNIMLKAYLGNDMFEEANKLFLKMLEDSSHISSRSDYNVRVIPDMYAFNTMLDACLKEKRWEEFEYVYEKMLNFGYHFNPKRHLSMVVDSSRAGKVGVLEMTWKQLIQSGRLAPPSLIKERAIAMLAEGDLSGAISTVVSADEDVHSFSKKTWLRLLNENTERLRRETLGLMVREAAHIGTSNPKLQNLVMSWSF